jgi:geranylgeranyl transferase type-2 subunit beta
VALQGADKLEHVATEHFWMSGMYWGLTAMALLGRLHEMDTAKILDWVRVAEVD